LPASICHRRRLEPGNITFCWGKLNHWMHLSTPHPSQRNWSVAMAQQKYLISLLFCFTHTHTYIHTYNSSTQCTILQFIYNIIFLQLCNTFLTSWNLLNYYLIVFVFISKFEPV
jgi:hypothetical protein